MIPKRCTRCRQEHPPEKFIFQGKLHRHLCCLCLEADLASTETKWCSRCQKEHPIREFYLKASGQRVSWCRSCLVTYQRDHRPKHPKATPTTKTCRTCEATLNISKFYARSSSPDGHHHTCKTCHAAGVSKSKGRTLLQTTWGPVSAVTVSRWMAEYRLSYSELVVITAQPYCAVCQSRLHPELPGKIDHDHKTGRVRGILCLNCNLILGHAKDQTAILQSALEYLQKHQAEDLKRPARRKVWE